MLPSTKLKTNKQKKPEATRLGEMTASNKIRQQLSKGPAIPTGTIQCINQQTELY